jgi:hypothetical protein
MMNNLDKKVVKRCLTTRNNLAGKYLIFPDDGSDKDIV